MTTAVKTPSSARIVWAGIFAIFATIGTTVGLIDPLEGGVALILGLVFLIVARRLSRVRIPKLAWISLIVSAAMMVAILTIAFIAQDPNAVMIDNVTVEQLPALAVLILHWPQRAATLVMFVGLVLYVWRIFQSRSKTVGSKTADSKTAGSGASK